MAARDDAMNFKALQAEIRGGTLRGVYLFCGEEENQKQAAWNALRKSVLPAGLEEMNETILEAPGADALIAACETLPLLGEQRLITVRDQPGLSGRTEPEEKLLDYLPRLADTTILVFYHIGEASAVRKLYKAIRQHGHVVRFDRMKGEELTDWVIRAFRVQGRACGRQAASLLLFTCGTDTGLLRTEIAKLASFVPEGEEVTGDHIRQVATPSMESSVFNLLDDVVFGRQPQAFRRLSELRLGGSTDPQIMYMLLRQCRQMRMVKILQLERRSNQELQKMLGVTDYGLQRLLRQAGSWSSGRCRDAVNLCLAAEAGLKSGRLSSEGAAESLMDQLFALGNPGQ